MGKQKANKPTNQQTNGIIYRSQRLQLLEHSIWPSQRMKSGHCRVNNQDRTTNLVGQFKDLYTKKLIVAANIHWPTKGRKGRPCVLQNLDQAAAESQKYPAALYLLAGDANISSKNSKRAKKAKAAWKPWYIRINHDISNTFGLGYQDIVYQWCKQNTTGSAEIIKKCSNKHWTLKVKKRQRIDYLFAKTDNPKNLKVHYARTISNVDVFGKKPAVDYSDHRAIHARITY